MDEKVEKRERGNRRRRGGDKEKEKTQDSRRREDEPGGGATTDQGKAEKDRDRRAADDRDNKAGKTGDTPQSKGRENRRESRRDNNNQSRVTGKDPKTERNADRAVERGDRNKSNANIATPTSKRYSKSDIRRSRNRTYSSSSASSVTSLDGARRGMDVESRKSTRLQPLHNNKEGVANSGEGRRRHLQSWAANGESSTESPDGSEMSDVAENKGRRRGGGEEPSAERRRVESIIPKGSKGGSRGILRVSLEKTSGNASHGGTSQQRTPVLVPRGRGGGILVLPARTDLSNSPEVGQRLLFGGIRGGGACRSRGGRGGARRLWDPNNPDQKPALTSTQSSPHLPLQQPIYLQTGTGYGQLHFLDTDDEVAGSPPVPQVEHFRTQQAAAMAYYKFQNSDNPYGYPVPTSNSHSPGNATNPRYPYPYQMGPYQMASPNGMYPGPGVGQFCGSYRGAGYSQPAAGGNLTLEEAEQQARGELGRLLRAADAQELQLSNLLSRDRVSAEGLDRMAQLR
ncbi:Telomerase-binding protein EST1A [Liparis tanakae]|uniref:Telomerase-binding protein EST1A n=1 Tax=Liparis tanakae TaxID=230148 RepID=A0A4Z2HNB0_9TELE|nr:Telomerase-binding protein EST1A [Liparis tanakae]